MTCWPGTGSLPGLQRRTYKYIILQKLVNDLNNKRKDILRDAFNNIRNYTKTRVLRNNLDIRGNQRKRILKE